MAAARWRTWKEYPKGESKLCLREISTKHSRLSCGPIRLDLKVETERPVLGKPVGPVNDLLGREAAEPNANSGRKRTLGFRRSKRRSDHSLSDGVLAALNPSRQVHDEIGRIRDPTHIARTLCCRLRPADPPYRATSSLRCGRHRGCESPGASAHGRILRRRISRLACQSPDRANSDAIRPGIPI